MAIATEESIRVGFGAAAAGSERTRSRVKASRLTRVSRKLILVFVLTLMLFGCTDRELQPSATCEDARAHVATLRLEHIASGLGGTTSEQYAQHARNIDSAMGREFIDECSQQGPNYIRCILKAEDELVARQCQE